MVNSKEKKILSNIKVDNCQTVANLFARTMIYLTMFESITNKIIITVFPINDILGYVMVLCAILVILTNRIYIYKNFWIYYTCFFGLLLLGVFAYNQVTVRSYLFQFISFGTCGLLCGFVEIDVKRIFKGGAILSIIFVVTSFLQNFEDAKVSQFAFGYALMPGIIATFFVMYNSYHEGKVREAVVWFIPLVIEVGCLVKYCSRGNLMQIYVLNILLLLLIFHKKFLGILGMVLGVVAVAFAEPLLVSFYLITEKIGIHISVLEKSYWLITTPTESLSHGRSELFRNVLSGIDLHTFVFGHGVGAYEAVYNTYVHNIFLQVFYETGLIGLFFIICIYGIFIKMLFDKKNYIYQTELYIALFILALVKLLFSSVHWREPLFWMVMVLVMNRISKKDVIIFKL